MYIYTYIHIYNIVIYGGVVVKLIKPTLTLGGRGQSDNLFLPTYHASLLWVWVSLYDTMTSYE